METWRTLALRGALGVLVGATLLAWPHVAFATAVLLFGFYAVVDGILALVQTSRSWLFVLEGLAGLAAGLLLVLASPSLAPLLTSLIATWALTTGVIEIIAAARVHREPLLAAAGVISVLLGIALFARPRALALGTVSLLGAYALFFGVALAISAMRARRFTGPSAA